MKIITWNSHQNFQKKSKKLIEKYQPDLMIIQECESKTFFSIPDYPYSIEAGPEKKGLRIFSKIKIDPLDRLDSCKAEFFLPIKWQYYIIFGIWAYKSKLQNQPRYIGHVWEIINQYEAFLSQPIIILGDFNWNIYWDSKPRSPDRATFARVKDKLASYQIYSGYHIWNNEEFGKEKTPTEYWRWSTTNLFHVDFIFMKEMIKIKKFSIGEYSDWREESDHMPVILEIE